MYSFLEGLLWKFASFKDSVLNVAFCNLCGASYTLCEFVSGILVYLHGFIEIIPLHCSSSPFLSRRIFWLEICFRATAWHFLLSTNLHKCIFIGSACLVSLWETPPKCLSMCLLYVCSVVYAEVKAIQVELLSYKYFRNAACYALLFRRRSRM